MLYVELGERRYPIYIGPAILDQPDLLIRYITGRQVLVISNTTVASLYLERITTACDVLLNKTIILPDGEQYKTLETLSGIFDTLMNLCFNRNYTLIALGGGVIGDITGFAAACYQRGVHYIQIPTTTH